MMNRILFSCLLLVVASCGYQFGPGDLPEYRKTISIPFITGDIDGGLTAALISAFSRAGIEYRQNDACTELRVVLLEFRDENIGFRYDRNQEGALLKTIIPTETRLSGIAEVTLIDKRTGCTLIGPVRLATGVEFDHDFYSTRNGVNVFSMGQLTDIDAARDAAQSDSLNQALAQLIVDQIVNSW